MKQFYETYTIEKLVSPLVSQLKKTENEILEIVSPLATQSQNIENLHEKFMLAVLTKIAWTNHLEIFSAVKDSGQRLFCILIKYKIAQAQIPLSKYRELLFVR